jgi:hypothetical protein
MARVGGVYKDTLSSLDGVCIYIIMAQVGGVYSLAIILPI